MIIEARDVLDRPREAMASSMVTNNSYHLDNGPTRRLMDRYWWEYAIIHIGLDT